MGSMEHFVNDCVGAAPYTSSYKREPTLWMYDCGFKSRHYQIFVVVVPLNFEWDFNDKIC